MRHLKLLYRWALMTLLPVLGQAQPTVSELRSMQDKPLQGQWEQVLGADNINFLSLPVTLEARGPNEGTYHFSEVRPLKLIPMNDSTDVLHYGTLKIQINKVEAKGDLPAHYAPKDNKRFDRFLEQSFPDMLVIEKSGKSAKNLGYNSRKAGSKDFQLDLLLKDIGLDDKKEANAKGFSKLPDLRLILCSAITSWAKEQDNAKILTVQNGRFLELPGRGNGYMRTSGTRNRLVMGIYDPAGFVKEEPKPEGQNWGMLLLALGLGLGVGIGGMYVVGSRKRSGGSDPEQVKPEKEYTHPADAAQDTESAESLEQDESSEQEQQDNSKQDPYSMTLRRESEEGSAPASIGPDNKESAAQIGSEPALLADSDPATTEAAPPGPDFRELQAILDQELDPEAQVAEMINWLEVNCDLDGLLTETFTSLRHKERALARIMDVFNQAPAQAETDSTLQETHNGSFKAGIQDLQSPGTATESGTTTIRSENRMPIGPIDLSDTLLDIKSLIAAGREPDALSRMAALLGHEGLSTQLERALERSAIVEATLEAIKTDRLAPEVPGDADWQAESHALVEQLRAMECLGRIAQLEELETSLLPFQSAGEARLRQALLARIATAAAGQVPAADMRSLYLTLWKQQQQDVRLAACKLSKTAYETSVGSFVHGYEQWNPEHPVHPAWEDHLGHLYARFGNILDVLHNAGDPPNPTEVRQFANQAFEMLIHFNDFMLIHLNQKRSRKTELNRQLALQDSQVRDLEKGLYGQFSPRVIDVPLVVRNARVMARSMGVSQLDGVLIDGFHIPSSALVSVPPQ